MPASLQRNIRRGSTEARSLPVASSPFGLARRGITRRRPAPHARPRIPRQPAPALERLPLVDAGPARGLAARGLVPAGGDAGGGADPAGPVAGAGRAGEARAGGAGLPGVVGRTAQLRDRGGG